MTDIQQGILKLLLELDGICKKHNITYYLIGGSALGAIRHQGFLPWDDDGDIVMTKDNWIKLKKAFETDLPPNRAYVGWDNYSDEPSVFYRYVNTLETDIHHSLWDHKMPWGGIIDIFVLNPLPKNKLDWEKYHKFMRRMGEYVMNSNILMNNRSSVIAYFYDCLCGKLRSPAYVKNKLYYELSKYDENECTHFSYLYPRLHITYPKEIFQAPRYVPFEGYMLPIPTLAEEHFRILYGDDWYNIPEDNSIIVHVAQHDTKRSYKEYMYDYLHYTDGKKVRKRSLEVKILKLLRERFRIRHAKRMAKLRAEYLGKLFTQHYNQRYITLKALCDDGKYSLLYQQFAPYYKEQLTALMQEHRIEIPIPAEILLLALNALIYAGYSRKARKIMALYENKAITHSDAWLEMETLLKDKNDLFIAYETQGPTFAQMAQELFAAYPWDKDIRLLMLWSGLQDNLSNDGDLVAMLAEAIEGEAQWPNAAEFLKVQADIHVLLGHDEEALELYYKVKENPNNGMLLLQMKNQLEWCEDGTLKILKKEESDHVGSGSCV